LEEGEEKIVLVTHDESIFYANDSKNHFCLLMVKAKFAK
jgi:hypothetical protein